MKKRSLGIVFALMLVGCAGLVAEANEPVVEFNRDIRPILSDKCFACHGPDKNTREGDLRLDVEADAKRDLGGYAAIVVGDHEDSELWYRITTDDKKELMPPAKSNKTLTAREKELLKRWIDQGAKWEDHWSFEPVKKHPVPDVNKREFVRNPIDAFILARLQSEGMGVAKFADRRTLIRRLYFDLIGLPPTPEQVEAFVKDDSEGAYEKVVDGLLGSEHFGERLAVYWLDLVRYADTLGYHGDQVRSVSPYRDYVIRAFNKNMPFDQFTIENLAGDLLPNATLDQKVASTYNRLNRASAEGGGQPKEYLAKYVADRVRTTSGAWLALTLGCAECHDHKFDPISAKDFYSFGAFFADIKEKGIVGGANHIEKFAVPTMAQRERLDEIGKRLGQLEAELNVPYAKQSGEVMQAFAAWEKDAGKKGDAYSVLDVKHAKATGKAVLEVQGDGAILATGPNPAKTTYLIRGEAQGDKVTGIKLDILPHDSLPAKGPGRASNGNFVMNEIEVRVNGQAVKVVKVGASHSQGNYGIENLLKNKTGWAILPQIGKANWGVFALGGGPEAKNGKPLNVEVKLVFNYGSSHALGHIKLSTTGEGNAIEAVKGVPGEIKQILDVAVDKRNAGQVEKLYGYFKQTGAVFKGLRDEIAVLKGERDQINKSAVTTLAVSSGQPRVMRVLPRGNWMDDSGEVVQPGYVEYITKVESKERLTRLDLAKWLVSKENPLTARVFTNRMWMLMFGRGITNTPDDFGAQGEWPTHPKLLDYLAGYFMDSGWDIKKTVKHIVMSNTYRLSTQADPEAIARDPYNKLFGRQSAFRLEAEFVRDNILAVSGLLVDELGGVSAKPYQPAGYWAQLNFPKRRYQADKGEQQYRRGVYTHWQRTFLHPSLLAFDAPAREECTAQRARSNTPLQALVLLNDPSYVEAARVFAQRILLEGEGGVEGRIKFAVREALQREATAIELKQLGALYEEELARYKADAKDVEDVLKVGLAPVSDKVDRVELASWMSVARVMFNLHETITRY